MSYSVHLPQRLANVASFITKGSQFADIGSDHAYLPCYVCLQDKQARAVAGEVAAEPFKSAQETVRRFDLSDRVSVRYGNGLNVLENGEVDSVVLAGMGGTLMKTLLDEGENRLAGVKRIIAQPNVGAPDVRRWLEQHHYSITDEAIVEENGHIYEIMAADKHVATRSMTEKQLLFGPHLLRQNSDTFHRKWHHELVRRRRIIEQMKQAELPDHAKIAAFAQESEWIEEVLYNGSSHTKR